VANKQPSGRAAGSSCPKPAFENVAALGGAIMSQQITSKAIDYFSIALESSSKPSVVTVSGVIPLNVILEVALAARSGATFNAMGLKHLATSVQHMEQKLDLIMKKLGIPNNMP
jgi:hypothetical protein